MAPDARREDPRRRRQPLHPLAKRLRRDLAHRRQTVTDVEHRAATLAVEAARGLGEERAEIRRAAALDTRQAREPLASLLGVHGDELAAAAAHGAERRVARPERGAIVGAEMREQRRGEAARDRERPRLGRGRRVDHDREVHTLRGVSRFGRAAAERNEQVVRLFARHLRGELRVCVHRDVAGGEAVRRAVGDRVGLATVEELDGEVGLGHEVERLDDDVLPLGLSVHSGAHP